MACPWIAAVACLGLDVRLANAQPTSTPEEAAPRFYLDVGPTFGASRSIREVAPGSGASEVTYGYAARLGARRGPWAFGASGEFGMVGELGPPHHVFWGATAGRAVQLDEEWSLELLGELGLHRVGVGTGLVQKNFTPEDGRWLPYLGAQAAFVKDVGRPAGWMLVYRAAVRQDLRREKATLTREHFDGPDNMATYRFGGQSMSAYLSLAHGW